MGFAARVKELRKSRGLDQSQLGSAIGISGASVSKWETGKSEPDINGILFLCDFFKISADYLLGRTEYKEFEWRDEFGLTEAEEEEASRSLYTPADPQQEYKSDRIKKYIAHMGSEDIQDDSDTKEPDFTDEERRRIREFFAAVDSESKNEKGSWDV